MSPSFWDTLYALFGLFWFGLEVTKISCRGHHCNVLVLGFSKRYNMYGFIWVFIISTFGSQDQAKSSQKLSDYRGGGGCWQARLLKSGMIWDEPFPYGFHRGANMKNVKQKISKGVDQFQAKIFTIHWKL